MTTPFTNTSATPHVRGFLHEPAQPNGRALVLTHGAGANCQTKLLTAVADAFAAAGFLVLRFDLPFRNERHFGPPRPGDAARDRDGLRRAVALIREQLAKISASNDEAQPAKRASKASAANGNSQPPRIFLGGHSYGGRQSTILASEDSALADALLLLSYPLHPHRAFP
jgi:predicted alpha/beta-hydrolase family hydrolase